MFCKQTNFLVLLIIIFTFWRHRKGDRWTYPVIFSSFGGINFNFLQFRGICWQSHLTFGSLPLETWKNGRGRPPSGTRSYYGVTLLHSSSSKPARPTIKAPKSAEVHSELLNRSYGKVVISSSALRTKLVSETNVLAFQQFSIHSPNLTELSTTKLLLWWGQASPIEVRCEISIRNQTQNKLKDPHEELLNFEKNFRKNYSKIF